MRSAIIVLLILLTVSLSAQAPLFKGFSPANGLFPSFRPAGLFEGSPAPAFITGSATGITPCIFCPVISGTTGSDIMSMPSGTVGTFLQTQGNSALPQWSPINLGMGVSVTGTLQTTNGGTGWASYSSGQLLIGNVSGMLTASTLTAGTGIGITNGSGSITIALSPPVSVANGGTGQTSYTNGQLLIGNSTGNTLSKANLTAGTGISITNSAGGITIANSSLGTVTSITAGTGLTGGTITASGTIGLSSPVSMANGGTNASLTATNGDIIYSTSSALAIGAVSLPLLISSGEKIVDTAIINAAAANSALGITRADKNHNFSTAAQAEDTSFVGWTFTAAGNPYEISKNNAGSTTWYRDTTGIVDTGVWQATPVDYSLIALKALGSSVKAQTPGTSITNVANSGALFDSTMEWIMVYVPTTSSISGVEWFQSQVGIFTVGSGRYNGFELFSYTAGNLTMIDSTARDSTLFKTGGSQVWHKTAFANGTHTLAPGVYYISMVWNAVAVSVTPQLGYTFNLLSPKFDFTNSAMIACYQSGIKAPITSTSMSVMSQWTYLHYLALY